MFLSKTSCATSAARRKNEGLSRKSSSRSSMTNPKPRYVCDTNVTVSALLFESSTPGTAFHAALKAGEILLTSATVLELRDVLSRKKFDRYLTREEREQFLVLLLHE